MLQDGYQKEMRQFDRERVLTAWDALAARQQAQLESLGVPNMSISSNSKDKEVQRLTSAKRCPLRLRLLLLTAPKEDHPGPCWPRWRRYVTATPLKGKV